MRKHTFLLYLLLTTLFLIVLSGCGKENTTGAVVHATVSVDVSPEALSNVSVSLPEGMTRETISDIQHDFIQNEKQVGGIVIVDISNELLDSPRGDNLLKITGILGEQLMSQENPNEIEFICVGGNKFAYIEIFTGSGEQIHYCHYLFRGETYNYDVWFNYGLVDEETIAEIIATVSADDITTELNNSDM